MEARFLCLISTLVYPLTIVQDHTAGGQGSLSRTRSARNEMLTDWDVFLLQECLRKLDGVNFGAHELFKLSELVGGLRCPAVIFHQRRSGQSKAVGGASRGTAVELDGQMTVIAAHLPHKRQKLRDFEYVLTENQDFTSGTGTTPDSGRRLQCELLRIDRLSSCGRVDSKTENVDGQKRFTACKSFTHCSGRTGLDRDEHLDGRRLTTGAVHTLQLDGPSRRINANGSKTGRKCWTLTASRQTTGRCCYSFVEGENEIHCEKRCELAWLEARRLWQRAAAETLTDWENWDFDGASALGNRKGRAKERKPRR